jgi:HK97 family phage major capsid protein
VISTSQQRQLLRFDSVVLKPKRVAGMTAFSTTLLAQSTPGIEGIAHNDLIDTIAIAVDQAALVGTGSANNQPLGILGYAANAAGQTNYGQRAPNVAFGEAANWGEVLDLEKQRRNRQYLGRSYGGLGE